MNAILFENINFHIIMKCNNIKYFIIILVIEYNNNINNLTFIFLLGHNFLYINNSDLYYNVDYKMLMLFNSVNNYLLTVSTVNFMLPLKIISILFLINCN